MHTTVFKIKILGVTNGNYSAAEYCLEPRNYGNKSRARVPFMKGEPEQRTDLETKSGETDYQKKHNNSNKFSFFFVQLCSEIHGSPKLIFYQREMDQICKKTVKLNAKKIEWL